MSNIPTTMGDYRLSLVARYDDLIRNTRVLTAGIEPEFIEFAANQETCLQSWMNADGELDTMKIKIKNLQNEINALETKLKHARSQIDQEIKKRSRAEQERDTLERQIMLVRELLVDNRGLSEQYRDKLSFLHQDYTSQYDHASPKKNLSIIEESASLLSPSDISYDKTEDDLETSYLRSGRKWKRTRPSAPPVEEEDITPPEKRHRRKSERKERRKHRRSRSDGLITTTATITVEDKGRIHAEADIRTGDGKGHRIQKSVSPSMKKYHSVGNVKDSGDALDHGLCESPKMTGFGSPTFLSPPRKSNMHSTPHGLPGLKRVNSAGRTLTRPHTFVSKTVIKSESCSGCGKKIGFGKIVMRCKDCRASSHPDCKELVPLPCIIPSGTPSVKSGPGILEDYSPHDPPYIPAIVIHCVNEVEAKGLNETGIYRIPGSEREVRELKEKFMKNKGIPHLANVTDIHVVCGCLKDFLRSLKEPIVTFRLWKTFANAAEIIEPEESASALYQAISELPRCNRDTLAFLMLHLQRVAESKDTQMDISNLSKVFGPTIVGFSEPNPEPLQMMHETRKTHMVVEKLMYISSDYWQRFVTLEFSDTLYGQSRIEATPNTPHRSEYVSMLGPLGTPTSVMNETQKKGWLTTPRFGRGRSDAVKKPNNFFASPDLN